MTSVAENEVEHGKKLAQGDAEATWGWKSEAGKLRYKRRAELIAKAAGMGASKFILEIGCGSGLFTEYFAGFGCKIMAVDISPDLLELAKNRGLPESQVEFVCSRFEDVGLEGMFDAVVGSSVLHHLDLDVSLDVISRLLKPGGKVAFAEPNMLNPQVFAERTFLRNVLDYVSPDETAFVRWSLKRELEGKGFTNISIQPFDWLHPATPKGLIPMINFGGVVIEKTPGFREFSGSLIIECQKPDQS